MTETVKDLNEIPTDRPSVVFLGPHSAERASLFVPMTELCESALEWYAVGYRRSSPEERNFRAAAQYYRALKIDMILFADERKSPDNSAGQTGEVTYENDVSK